MLGSGGRTCWQSLSTVSWAYWAICLLYPAEITRTRTQNSEHYIAQWRRRAPCVHFRYLYSAVLTVPTFIYYPFLPVPTSLVFLYSEFLAASISSLVARLLARSRVTPAISQQLCWRSTRAAPTTHLLSLNHFPLCIGLHYQTRLCTSRHQRYFSAPHLALQCVWSDY